MKRLSGPERAFNIYSSLSADERREFWAFCQGFDKAMGLGEFTGAEKRRRGRPVGSGNKPKAVVQPPEAA